METSPVVKPTLAIAVLTFRRPAPLADLIPLLIEQARAVSNEAAAYVLVVDNDPDRSAESLVAQFADQGVVYANEPEPGIATARNRAMKAAANTDLLVFIDDDEVPDPYYGLGHGFDLVLDMVEDASRGLVEELKEKLKSG